EIQAIYDSGWRGHLDFVDDNFIGNKKAVKAFLPYLIEWQQEHGYPYRLSTEASINIADDDALLALMRAANFITIFVGIESPDTDTPPGARRTPVLDRRHDAVGPRGAGRRPMHRRAQFHHGPATARHPGGLPRGARQRLSPRRLLPARALRRPSARPSRPRPERR